MGGTTESGGGRQGLDLFVQRDELAGLLQPVSVTPRPGHDVRAGNVQAYDVGCVRGQPGECMAQSHLRAPSGIDN
ncbi:hypothetical protein D3C81_1394460 [compost metagenome]